MPFTPKGKQHVNPWHGTIPLRRSVGAWPRVERSGTRGLGTD